MKPPKLRHFGNSCSFRYSMIAITVSGLYVFLSFYLEHELGVQKANPLIIQLSPILFGVLGFVIGHKEDRYREAENRAGMDFLTGLPNHSNLQHRLRVEISRANRYGRSLSLLMIDLDHFKYVNDTFGHQKGDEVLRLTGKFLNEETRRYDFAARYGGEEFVVLLPEVDGSTACLSAERLRSSIGKIAHQAGIPNGFISISIGVGDCPICATDASSLLAVADTALLFAKRKGRNRVAYFRDLHDIELEKNDFTRLRHRLEGATLQSLKALVAAVETFDLYSDDHNIDVIASNLADRLGMSQKQRELLILASQLHDVGKVGVPSSVLNKKGRLGTDDMELVKRHPEMGKRLLQEVAQMQELFSAILYHHERWDGKGYPEGLKGKQIPIMARIVGILDAYRAMVSNRPYRAALSKAQAIDELRRGSGSQFDPSLIEPFVDLLQQNGEKNTLRKVQHG